MKKFISLVLVFGVSLVASAGDDHGHHHGKKAAKKHGHQHAHSHGAGELNIAFSDLIGKVEFKAAADGVLGFEYEAKSAEDKEKLAQAVDYFKNQGSKILSFDAALDCVITNEKAEQTKSKKKHSDFVATYSVKCMKPVSKSKLTIDLTQFSGLKDVDVQILVGTNAVPTEYKGKSITIDLP